MGQTRAERTWPKPRRTRHVWAQLREKHPHEPPAAAVIVTWRKRQRAAKTGGTQPGWEAWVIAVIDDLPRVVSAWIPAAQIRPITTDPNRLFGLR